MIIVFIKILLYVEIVQEEELMGMIGERGHIAERLIDCVIEALVVRYKYSIWF